MFKIAKENLVSLWRAIKKDSELYLPTEVNGQNNFLPYSEENTIDLDTLKTVRSAKDVFFPQSEALYTVTKVEKKLNIQAAQLLEQEFVLFGVRACDVAGIAILDRVFLCEPIDSFYAARRANGVVVSLACNQPVESCFCSTFEIDCTSPAADVDCFMLGETLYWNAITEKGEALTKKVGELFQTATKEDLLSIEQEKNSIKDIIKKLPYANLSLVGWNGEQLAEKFDSKLWEKLYMPCIACGTCTFVCPTCQCYDIKDYSAGGEVQRSRVWDSCMYSDFTMMAHGNIRNSQMQRFRQRYMHKLVYFPANNEGVYSCVGCGRCVEKCPASLNIVKVIKAFSKKEV